MSLALMKRAAACFSQLATEGDLLPMTLAVEAFRRVLHCIDVYMNRI